MGKRMPKVPPRLISKHMGSAKRSRLSGIPLLLAVLTASALYVSLLPFYKNGQLVDAIRRNDPEKVQAWLQCCADPNTIVAAPDRQSIWQNLYDTVFRRNASIKPKYYALQMAMGLDSDLEPLPNYHLSPRIVCTLLAGGANPNVTDRYGTPMVAHIVMDGSLSQEERVTCLKAFFAKGADINAETRNRISLLYCSIGNNDIRSCRLLVEKGAKCQAYGTPVTAIGVAKRYDSSQALVKLLQRFRYK